MNNAIIPHSPTPSEIARRKRALERVINSSINDIADLQNRSMSVSTRRNYANALRYLVQWCVDRELLGDEAIQQHKIIDGMKATERTNAMWESAGIFMREISAEVLHAYIVDMYAAGVKANTLTAAFAALSHFYTRAGLEDHATSSRIRATLRGARVKMAEDGQFVEAKRAVSTEEWLKIAAAAPRATLKDRRDFALMMVGLGAGLRPSEVMELRIEDIKDRGDIVTIKIRQSKKNQVGEAEYLVLVPATGSMLPLCPVTALREWLRVYTRRRGYLFPYVKTTDTPLDTPIAQTSHLNEGVVRPAMERAGVEYSSAHGAFRATMSTWLIWAGADPADRDLVLRHNMSTGTKHYTDIEAKIFRMSEALKKVYQK